MLVRATPTGVVTYYGGDTMDALFNAFISGAGVGAILGVLSLVFDLLKARK